MEQTRQNVSPMSNEGRNAYVIEHLTDAFLKLLDKKPISEISIRELCDSAGVGRTSFYRNFETKEDILTMYIRQLFEQWIKKLGWNQYDSLSKSIQIMFAHFEKYREFYSLLNKREAIYLLKDIIIELCGPKPEHTAMEAYAKAFVAYSLYGWIEVWFQRGMQESAEELTKLFQKQGL